MFVIDDVFQFAQKPGIDLGQFVDTLHRVSLLECLGNGENTQIRGVGQLIVQIFEADGFISYETVHSLSDHPESLLDDLFERTTDRHDFPDRFHARTDLARNSGKLRQVPPGNFTDQVIQARGNVGRVGCSHFADLVERISQCHFSGDKGQRIACCL